jgi:hypothetical protein
MRLAVKIDLAVRRCGLTAIDADRPRVIQTLSRFRDVAAPFHVPCNLAGKWPSHFEFLRP